MEIERRFYIDDLSNIDLSKYEKKTIIQDYLYRDGITAVRKRKTVNDEGEKYCYTVKTKKVGISVNEIESSITKIEYDKLELNPNYKTISKNRYIIPYIEGLKIELDVFLEDFEGLVFAEIEFESEEQANKIELPSWFGKELSTKITNVQMTTMTKEEVLDLIKK